MARGQGQRSRMRANTRTGATFEDEGQAKSLLYMRISGRFLYIVGVCPCTLPFDPRAF